MLRKQTLKPNQNLNENYLQILKCLVCPLLSLDLKLPDASLSNDDLFILKSKLSKMSLILASSNKLFDSCFSNSATLFLKHQKLALNLSQIILLFASIVSSQLSKESSIDSDIDHLIIRVTELFISQIRSTLLESKTSISADILTRRESWIAIIAPLLKSRIGNPLIT